MKTVHRPPTVSLAAEVTSPDLTAVHDGGWTYGAIAQLYKKVNQHLLYFFPGSGTKTIQERVPRSAVKIESGHPGMWPANADVESTLGFVQKAEERQSSMRYTGFLSKSSEEVADKIADRTITENSMVVVVMTRVPKSVDIQAVPEVSREFVSLDKDGNATVTGVKEYRWETVGLVPGSSQDINAITSPPTMVGSVAGLSVASAPWDATVALSSLRSWGGENLVKLSRAYLAEWYGPDGELVLAGLVASPDEAGALVVNAFSMPAAMRDVEAKLACSGMAEGARGLTLAAARRQAQECLSRLHKSLTAALDDGKPQPGAAGIASGPVESIALATADDDDPITATATSHEPAGPATPPTVGSEETDKRLVTIAHQDLNRRLDAAKVRYQQVADESATTGGGSPEEGIASRS